jgi:hypothetical protein
MRLDPADLARARIRRPTTQEDLDRATAFLETPHAREIVEAHPEERGSIRFLEVDDRILAAILFNPVPLLVRGTPVRCARILETNAEDGRAYFRETGDRELFDLMIEELLGYLWARRYPLCYAHGELALYAPQGFAPCFYHARVYLDVSTALQLPTAYRVRRLKSSDVRRLPALRQGNQRWKPQVFGTGVPPFHHFCVETPERELKGYFSLEVDAESTWHPKVFVPEVEATSRKAAFTILSHCAQQAQKIGLSEIHFPLAPGHPFALVCLELGGRSSIRGASCDPLHDEEMVSAVDRRGLLEALQPGMQERLRRSPLHKAKRSISLKTDRGSWTLAARDGAVEVGEMTPAAGKAIRIPDWMFVQLLFGYRSTHEVAVKMTLEARELLHVLLPKTWPYSMPDPDLWEPATSPLPFSKAAQEAARATELPWTLGRDGKA